MPRRSKSSNLKNLPPGTIRHRLAQLIGDEAVYHFANRVGVPDSSLRKYLSGSQPTADKLAAIASATGVSLRWLITGEGAQYAEEQESLVDDTDRVSIPLHDVEASAGPGAILDAPLEEVDRIDFCRHWIRQQFCTSPEGLVLIYVRGESMEPTLRSGDIILVDRKATEPKEGIYVVRLDGTLLVKRLQVYPGRRIEVYSDNPNYKPYDLNAKTPPDDFAVIGRVLMSMRSYI